MKYPLPNQNEGWFGWAVRLVNSMNNTTANAAVREPLKPPHIKPGDKISATENGIIIYDPVSKNLLVAKDGEWYKIITENLPSTVTGL